MRTYLWRTEFLLFLLVASLAGCATGHYTPLGEAGNNVVEQLKENVYRVEYRGGVFTSQVQLNAYLRQRCAELTLREGYDFFSDGWTTGRAGTLTPRSHNGDAVQGSETRWAS